jgi:hypothetical protein
MFSTTIYIIPSFVYLQQTSNHAELISHLRDLLRYDHALAGCELVFPHIDVRVQRHAFAQ